MLRRITDFFAREWKKIAILALIAIAYQFFSLAVLHRMDPQRVSKAYDQLGGFVVYTLKATLEFTITYYVYIYVAWLPLLQKRKVWQFIIASVLMLGTKFTYTILVEFPRVDYHIPPDTAPSVKKMLTDHKLAFYAGTVLFMYLVSYVICLIVAVVIDFNLRKRRQKELEREKTNAELAAIKYQINPHFLFNSLSFIYSKTVPLSDEVAGAVLLLSDIMRYALGNEEDAEGKVALEREVTHLKNVIEINQMRFNRRLSIQYLEELERPGARIMPLVLITLVENAFKHGNLLDETDPLVIHVKSTQEGIHFFIRNQKKKGPKELSTGIGLANVKDRLRLMYPDRHRLEITDTAETYTVDLTIKL
ncbi:sensor histidine kinase [Chitinophaga lutea]